MTHNLSAVTLDRRVGRAKVSVYIGADVMTDPEHCISQGDRFQLSYAQTAASFLIHLTPVQRGGLVASLQPSPDRPLRVVHCGAWQDRKLEGWHPFRMVRSSIIWDDANKWFCVEVSKALAEARQSAKEEAFAPAPVLEEQDREVELELDRGVELEMRRSVLNEAAVWLLRNARNFKPGELAGAMLEDLDNG